MDVDKKGARLEWNWANHVRCTESVGQVHNGCLRVVRVTETAYKEVARWPGLTPRGLVWGGSGKEYMEGLWGRFCPVVGHHKVEKLLKESFRSSILKSLCYEMITQVILFIIHKLLGLCPQIGLLWFRIGVLLILLFLYISTKGTYILLNILFQQWFPP